MAKAKSECTPPAGEAEWSLAEIYAHVHKRDLSALPEIAQKKIIEAWHERRLPLIAAEEQDYRRHSRLKPLIWRGRPSPDHDIEVVAGAIPKRGMEERQALWESRGASLPAPPGDLPTAIRDPFYEKSPADPPDQLVEVLKDQSIPAGISLADIKFNWVAGAANWHDKATGAITQFLGVKAKRADVEQIWPRQARVGGRPSSEDLIREQAGRLLREGPLPKTFKEFANGAARWLAANHPQTPWDLIERRRSSEICGRNLKKRRKVETSSNR